LDALENQQELLDAIKASIASSFAGLKSKFTVPKRKKKEANGKKKMTLELLISDIHVGKFTEGFNLKVLGSRLKQIAVAVEHEVDIRKDKFDIEQFILAFLGDIVESSTMHGEESLLGCEITNSEQVVESVKLLFDELLVPLYKLGIPIHVPCLVGNHDRWAKAKTYQSRGRESMSFIIYKMLEQMCDLVGMEITFDIPDGIYTTTKIYDDLILYEHGDECGKTKEAMEARIGKRQKQMKELVTFFRLGHWHELAIFERGRIIINGSICGADDYSDAHGFDTVACQVLNFYCKTSRRPNSYYQTFPIYLD
jgi:hypothetical protein